MLVHPSNSNGDFEKRPGDEPVPREPFIDRVHERISRSLLSSAEWIDSFFYTEHARYEENRTRFRLGLSAFLEEGEDREFDADMNLNLVLPHLERRFRFEIAGDPRDDVDFGSSAIDEVRERFEETDKRNTTVALRYFFTDTQRENISTGSGLRFRGINPTFYLEGRYRRSFSHDPWVFRFTQRIRWYTDKGLESRTRFDLDRRISEDFLLRLFTEGSWYQQEDGYFYSVGLSVYQPIDERRSFEYQFANSFRTEPKNRREETVLRVRYRQQVWKRWIFGEIAPQISWRRERDFDGKPGVLMRLEAIFGRW